MTSARPIVVTGTHRSGTTWVGEMISSSPQVTYVHEPFNYPLWPQCPLKRYFCCITEEEEGPVLAYLREVHGVVPPARGRLSLLRRWARAARRRPRRPLLKEPYGLFAADWLARTYDAQVVVLIRHPAAFAGSLKRLSWPFGSGPFLEQPRLMRARLAPFREDLERHEERRADIIDDAILLWRVVYHTVRELQAEHPEWLFLRHEDLSLRPLEEFQGLFARLDLALTPAVRATIQKTTSEENPKSEVDGEAFRTSLDSKANIWNWRKRLLPEEVERIRRGTEDVAPFFYTDADWEGPSQRRRGRAVSVAA